MTKHVMAGALLSAANAALRGVIVLEANTLESLRAEFQRLQVANEAIVNGADGAERDLEDSELETINSNTEKMGKIAKQIAAREAVQPQGAGRRTAPEPNNRNEPGPGGRQMIQPPSNGRTFASLGEFALAVHGAAVHRRIDNRLYNASASTISTEGTGADGGFAVPPETQRAIRERVFGEQSLIGMSDQNQSASNTVTFPMDMTTPWQTSGGVQCQWEGEAAAIGQSKVALEYVTMKLHKLAALVPITDELLEDAPALTGYLNRKVPEKMDFALSYAMAWGNGVGRPLGWMNAPCLVTQAAEAGPQTADTIVAANIAKMYARMPTNGISTAAWLIHPDAWPQLPLMTIGNWPVYAPPTGLAGAPFGTLMGRPIFPHQVCETVGDLGDIMFVDLKQYLTITKAGGVKSDVSIHLWFDQNLTAFRFTVRVAGQPWWSAAVSSRDGTFTQSPFVTLAAR